MGTGREPALPARNINEPCSVCLGRAYVYRRMSECIIQLAQQPGVGGGSASEMGTGGELRQPDTGNTTPG